MGAVTGGTSAWETAYTICLWVGAKEEAAVLNHSCTQDRKNKRCMGSPTVTAATGYSTVAGEAWVDGGKWLSKGRADGMPERL